MNSFMKSWEVSALSILITKKMVYDRPAALNAGG